MKLQFIPPAIAICYLLTVTGIAQTVFLAPFPLAQAPTGPGIPNELIDAPGFVHLVNQSQMPREKSRLPEEQFLNAIRSGDYVLLDARSTAMYHRRHLEGAVNLPLTEFTADTLAAVIPNRDAKILIYCNNNFLNSPAAFPAKSERASLNLHTQASLRAYGYEQIYELGPLLDIHNTQLTFAGSEVTDD